MYDDAHSLYEALFMATAQGEAVALATVIMTQGSMPRRAGSKMLIWADGAIIGTVGGGAMESQVILEGQTALKDGKPRLCTYTLNSLDEGDLGVCGGTAQIFIEPINRPATLLVIGGGHVGKALCELAKWAGYRVALCDDRQEFCSAAYIAGLDDYIVCKPAEVAKHITIDSQTYVACVTRGLPIDIELIPVLLASSAAYIGFIGSKRRWALTTKAVEDRFGIKDLSRIHAPIGLELHAETPKEIAMSIMAQIILMRRGGMEEA